MFSHNGDFSALISANSVASPARFGNVNIHEVLLSLIKASCCSRVAAAAAGDLRGSVRGGASPAEVNQCFIAGLASGACVSLGGGGKGGLSLKISLK